MPHFDPNAPRVERTYNGVTFSVPQPYAAGQTLDAGHAAFLNRVMAGTIGNRHGGELRSLMKAHNAKAKKADQIADIPGALGLIPDHQAWFDEAYAAYEPGAGRSSGGKSNGASAIDRLIRTLATEEAKARIIAKGLTVQAFMRTKAEKEGRPEDSKFTVFVDKLIAENEDRYREVAEQSLAQSQEDTTSADELLDALAA